MNRDEAKQILTIYRPGTTDARDPEVAAALALAGADPELSRWFDENCARQYALRDKFRQMAAPAGLKEQIISEHAARTKAASWRERVLIAGSLAAICLSLAVFALMYWPRNTAPRPIPNTLASYQDQMMKIAVTPYYMAGMTNSDEVRAYLAHNHAPSDYALPGGLNKIAVTGCAVQLWQRARASMICFRAGKMLPPHQAGDLWLFIIDQAAVNGASLTSSPEFTKVNGLITATWTQNGKLYLLGTKGDEQTIRQYL